MIKLFKVPNHDFKDFFEKARFALTWKICLMFFVVVSFITSLTFISGDQFFPYYLIVWVVMLASLIYLFYSKDFKLVSTFIIVTATLVIIAAVFFVYNVLHVIEILWMVIIILFSFFTLGRVWGIVLSIVTVVVFITYFNTLMYENISNLSGMNSLLKDIMNIEFVFAFFLIVFIMSQIIQVNNYAEETRRKAFDDLQKEKETINQKNKEKTFLLQEIHHRVKNNLQVIISLLRIQSGELKSQEAIKSFNEAINRIMTMSLIHQKMYETESLYNIDLNDYISTLVDDIIRSNTTNEDIDYNIESNLISLDIKTLVPFALIINELVSNSLKHAFDKTGKINIKIFDKGNDFYLDYSDNGQWKEPTGSSLGLQLIDIFTEQLEGDFKRETTDLKTSFIFSFKKIAQVVEKK